MSTSRAKAKGSAAEREVAKILNGVRVGQDGGPVDVVSTYLAVQVKKLATLPSFNAVGEMLDRMKHDHRLRAAVVIEAAGRGKRGKRFIVFDLDEYADWHIGMRAE